MEAVRPLHRPLGPPLPNEWLASYPEPVQTFDAYLASDPVTARGERRVLYIQPLGTFTAAQRRVVSLTAEFLGLYFDLPVKTLDDLPLDAVPASARRARPDLDTEQILAGYVTHNVLKPILPADAAVCIALTSADLWPGDDWNFVFGQASTVDRVGVWSMHRYGDPSSGDAAFLKCLLRTLKIAGHETGHMFTIQHCAQYECCMCGAMSLPETDDAPLELCPECMAKVCWATGADPEKRFERLAAFCAANGLDRERRFYERSLAAVRGEPAPDDPVGRAEDALLASARADIERWCAPRADGWRRRDAAASLACTLPQFVMVLGNGIEVDRPGLSSMLDRAWRRAPQGGDDHRFVVEDVRWRGGEAEALIRHEYPGGVTRTRETWVRTSSGWRLGLAREFTSV